MLDVLKKVQQLALRHGASLKAIEINPLWTGDGEPTALDGLVVTAVPKSQCPAQAPVAEKNHV